MFTLLPLLATILAPLLLATAARAAPHDRDGINALEHTEPRVEAADRALLEHGVARELRHDPIVKKRDPGVVEVSVLERRDAAAVAALAETNVRLRREKRWGQPSGGWAPRGGCCGGGCPGRPGW
jgi:hypothetical protein